MKQTRDETYQRLNKREKLTQTRDETNTLACLRRPRILYTMTSANVRKTVDLLLGK